MKVFISPPTETDWTVNADELAQAIRAEYCNAKTAKATEGGHSLEWTLKSGVEGCLDSARNTIVLEGDIEGCACFAIWYRKLVPVSQPLVFFDESYSADIKLGTGTTMEELIAPFVG